MKQEKADRPIVPLCLAAALLLPAAALAQPAPAPPAPAATRPAAKPVPRPAPVAASHPASQATLLGQFGDWGAYTASPNGRKVCFALAKPTASQDNPPNRRTATNVVYMFISTRPEERVKDEVSVLVTGYVFKPNSEANFAVGGAPFAMYTQNDGAWVKNAADEARMVESMRKASDAVIKATTSKGTQTTDTFSLKGISQALDRVAQECR